MQVLNQVIEDNWTMFHGDCCEVIRGIPDASIDCTIHSPPFSSLYIYSDSEADMGNCASDDEFFEHYGYLIPELYRVTVPGRLCIVHCKDLPKYANRDGAAGLTDFPGMIVRAFEDAGWTYHSRVTIWKCPVIERARTNSYGLLHGQLVKDSAASRQGMPDYLLVFRKWDGMAAKDFPKPVNAGPENVAEQVRFESYVGSLRPGTGLRYEFREDDGTLAEVLVEDATSRILSRRDYSIQVWQRYASPVWFDINQTNVLQNYRKARSAEDEKHICPLQLDVIERCVHLWTNPGDVVLSPFAGIGSEGYVATKMGRKFVGIELKESYFEIACSNLRIAAEESKAGKLF